MSEDKKTEAIATPIGRVSWASLFGEGDEKETGKCKYKLTLMLPKNKAAIAHLGMNPEQQKAYLKKVEAFIEEFKSAAIAFAKQKYGDKYKSTRWNPLLDGDNKDWEGNKNFWLLRTKTQFKVKVRCPKVEDGFIQDGDDDERTGFYNGCWARIYLNFYAYNTDGNKGIGCGLAGVQKAWNDEVFTGGGAASFDEDVETLSEEKNDFDDDEPKPKKSKKTEDDEDELG